MKIMKRSNEGTEKKVAGRLFGGTSTAESDIEVLPSTEPLTSHEYVRSPRLKSSINAVYDDMPYAPSLHEQENEHFANINHKTSLRSPAFDLNHDNLSNDTDDDYCVDSPVEISFDKFRQVYVRSRSTDLPTIQEEDEREIHDLDNELDASMVKCSFDTDKGKEDKLHPNYSLGDRLELIDQSCALLAPSITRWSDEDLSGHQEELSASDLARRLFEVNMQRERQTSISKRFLKILHHKVKGGASKLILRNSWRFFLAAQK
ncbi:hypothetical protein BOTCAL_0317g00100 [Botryotinia calthae]|uniref:Uncharacterized protein n=1 Tax=Botryotinia calthae TaxID=38488 RepID=A0A4Y8CTR8_9HELO|nr:hypothetical protein BOTCAL_0317g00100 [Botryotinia calthae]